MANGRQLLQDKPKNLTAKDLSKWYPKPKARGAETDNVRPNTSREISPNRMSDAPEQIPRPFGERPEYSVDEIISDGCFLTRAEIEGALEILRRKKNLVLMGPPGTGKTWLAKRLGYALLGMKKCDRVRAVQFHPSLSYEEFVRGWRFSDGVLALIDGAFLEFAELARLSEEPFIFVIEEINRGNPAQILGEMLNLLEADKRNDTEALRLTYPKASSENFHIPPNLYVIGTMNVADRSLALVDLALRRRFAFLDLEPRFGEQWAKWCSEAGMPRYLIDLVQTKMKDLNEVVAGDKSLGVQFRVGHSFVTPVVRGEPLPSWDGWLKQVIQSEIGPLLRDYWYDNEPVYTQELEKLLAGSKT